MIEINKSSVAKALIKSGKVNKVDSWTFTADEGNKILENGWDAYGAVHLVVDTDNEAETKAYYKFPVIKNGRVYRSGVIAAKQRAAQQGYDKVVDLADELLQMIDGEKGLIKTIINQLKALQRSFEKPVVGVPIPAFMLDNLKQGLAVSDYNAELQAIADTGRITAAKAMVVSQWLNDNVDKIVDDWTTTPDYVAHLLHFSNGDGEAKVWLDSQAKTTSQQLGGFSVRKQLDGTWRWFGIVTNKFMDRDGDILTDSAHAEFNNYLDANPDYAPELWAWHVPGTARKHRADWWDYSNGFFVYSGVLTAKEAAPYIDQPDVPIGMSHGFFILEKVGRFITRYRTFEVSELPLDVAANPYTDFGVLQKETKMKFSERKRGFLTERYGDEAVAALEGNLEGQEKMLMELDVDWKSINAEYEAEIEAKLADRVKSASEATVATIVKEVVNAMRKDTDAINTQLGVAVDQLGAVGELKATVAELVEKVTVLEQTKDSWVASALTATAPVVAKPDNVLDVVPEDIQKQAKEALASNGWMANLVPQGGE